MRYPLHIISRPFNSFCTQFMHSVEQKCSCYVHWKHSIRTIAKKLQKYLKK